MDTNTHTETSSIQQPAEQDIEETGTHTQQAVPMNPAELEAERRLIRRMQLMMSLVMQTIAQDASLTYDEAAQMIADARRAALTMFPGKDLAYDLIWRPRFQRLMLERFRLM